MSEYNKFEAGKMSPNKPDPNDKKSSSGNQKISTTRDKVSSEVYNTIRKKDDK